MWVCISCPQASFYVSSLTTSFTQFLAKNIKVCPRSEILLFTSLNGLASCNYQIVVFHEKQNKTKIKNRKEKKREEKKIQNRKEKRRKEKHMYIYKRLQTGLKKKKEKPDWKTAI